MRARQADGSFVPESDVFAQGGSWKGAMKDESIDDMSFMDVAHAIAYPLANQNYIPSRDPGKTKLLIMVYWGTTHGAGNASDSDLNQNLQAAEGRLSSGPPAKGLSLAGLLPPHDLAIEGALDGYVAEAAAENQQRRQNARINAMMLGYDSPWAKTAGDRRGTALELEQRDLLNELDENRYFVVLMAYDFQLFLEG